MRNDLSDTEILYLKDYKENDINKNYIILSKNTGYILLNNFKTNKKYGSIKYDFKGELLRELIKYNELPKSKRDELEANIKMDRVRDAIRNNSVIYGDMEVTEYDWKAGNYILKGFNKDTGEKMPDKLVKSGAIASETFIDSKTKKEIEGNPLK
jgi:hypothetical protein